MTTGYSKSYKVTGSLRCQRCLPPAAQRALKKSVPLLADRRKHTGLPMNLSLKTGFGSVCSVVPRIRWTSCRRTPKPDRYRDFWNTTPETWFAPNSCLRRRWDTPLMSRSGGNSTISMRS